MRILAAAMLSLALTACASNPYPGEPASAHARESIDEEAFILTIDAGRIAVFNDRIKQAGELLEAPLTGGDELIGISKRLRSATLEFLAAKENLCSDVKFVEVSCVAMRPPSWLAEDPTKPVTVAQLRSRVEQVQNMMGPLIDAACTYGKEKSGDGLFCSVE